MNKAQSKQLDILIEVDRLCRKHNIKYFIIAGTLLGAVRHKGFIPWDDDIDIGMNRKEYEKFKKIALKEMNKKYFYQDLETDKCYGYTFAKIRINNTKYIEEVSRKTKAHCGIYIDVFPIDKFNPNYEFMFKKIVFYRMLLLLKKKYIIKTDTFVKKVELLLLKIFKAVLSTKFIIKRINTLINKCSKDGEYVVSYSTNLFHKTRYLKKWYDETIEFDFEGYKFKGTKYYDEFLTYLYGDYMQLPPEDKRVDHSIVEIEFDDVGR